MKNKKIEKVNFFQNKSLKRYKMEKSRYKDRMKKQ